MVRFAWDRQKAAENLRKHGVAFEDAVRVFRDPWRATRLDIHRGEERFQTIGMPSSAYPLILLVVHTHHLSDDNDEEEVRIISARRATPSERRAYEEGQF
jgi:uncharacterized DUF497 family protein